MGHYEIAKRFEGEADHFYLDGRGIVTIGVGCQVFDPTTLPMLIRATNLRAGTAEILADYRAIKALEPNRVLSYYAKVAKLYLPATAIRALFDTRLNDAITQLRQRINLSDKPEAAMEAIVDMAFNLGVSRLFKEFPKFVNAFSASDWKVCALEYKREGIQSDRNDWTRNQFEGLVA